MTGLEELKSQITPILKENDVAHAAIFGSFVRNEQRADSDLDLVVEFNDEHKSLLDLVGLQLQLEEVLGRPTDVVTYDCLHPQIRAGILQEQVIVL
jgi:predicted nucleotidyltransferase